MHMRMQMHMRAQHGTMRSVCSSANSTPLSPTSWPCVLQLVMCVGQYGLLAFTSYLGFFCGELVSVTVWIQPFFLFV